MLVLLDESVPRGLRRDLSGHQVLTVQQQGWSEYENGELLARAEDAGFTAFITADQNLQHQQNLTLRKIRIVVLAALRNTIEEFRPLVPQILAALQEMREGELRVLKPAG